MENENKEEQPIEPNQIFANSMQEAADKERIKNENYHRFLKELQTEPKYQKYFEQFNPITIENFINSYAFNKAHWLSSVQVREHMQSNDGLRYQKEAEACLKEILQKKLFDLQCQWRAEQITLPNVQCTADMSDWEFNILNCPFIEPITQREIEIYLAYMQSANYDEDTFYDWQNYEEIKGYYNEADEDDDNFPDWYIFYDNQMGGNKGLILLPDTRGEKERKYMQLARTEIHEKAAQAPPPDPRPFLPSTYDFKFTRKFIVDIDGDKDTLTAFDLFVDQVNKTDNWENNEAESAYYELSVAEDPFPIFGEHTDWRLALIATAAEYRRLKTMEALPIVYDEYLFRKQSGIAFEVPENIYPKDYIREMILRGRELAGEPRDFNF